MDYKLNSDQVAIKEMAERFTADKITPNASEWDKDYVFPQNVIREAAGLGFGGIYIPESDGGIGLGRIEASLIMEAMAYGCPSTSAFISIHNMAAWMVSTYANEELKSRYLPDLIPMNKMASYCLTEPNSGSDAASLKTKAVRSGEYYILNGTKAFISGAGTNEIYICMVRTGDSSYRGISCLLVEKDTPGVTFGANEHKLGWHSQPTAMVNFEDAKVPVTNLIGNEGDGFKIAMAGLDGGRINIAACSIGGAQRCLDETIQYVKDRKQFNKAIAEFQNTQFMLADMATGLTAAQALLRMAAQKVTEDAPDKTSYAAMAKLYATDACSKIANDALQLHGGYGYLMDYPIERIVRDLRVHEILEGTNQIMRMVVGRDLIK